MIQDFLSKESSRTFASSDGDFSNEADLILEILGGGIEFTVTDALEHVEFEAPDEVAWPNCNCCALFAHPWSSESLPCEAIEAVTPSFIPKNRTKSLVLRSSSTSSTSSSSSTTTISLK